jgi:preprotein translocase subunit SecE
MDQKNKKIITVSFICAGALTAYVLSAIIQILQASVSYFARLAESELFTHALPVGVGILVFLFLQLNPKLVKWAEDVVTEIRRMVWIGMKETTAVTIAVCIMVIISGVVLGVLDFVSSKVVNYLISL